MRAQLIALLLSQYRRWGLRARLVLLVIAAISPLLLFSLHRAADQAQAELERARASLEFAVSLAGASQERVAESARLLLTAITSLPNLLDGRRLNCDAYFDALRGKFPAYANFGLIDRDGITRCHALNSTEPGYAGDRSYFKLAVANRAFTISEYQVGRLTAINVIVFALPLLDANGEVAAVAFAALDMKEIGRSLQGIKLPEGGRMAVLDRLGNVLATTNPAFTVGQPVANRAILAAVREQRAAVGEGPDAAGNDRIYAVSPGHGVAKSGLFVLVNVDRSAVISPTRERLVHELLLILLVATAGSVAAWLVGGTMIARPASEILKAIVRIRSGKLETRVAIGAAQPSNEFAHIADGFNLMAESLQQRHSDLQNELAHSRQAYATLDLVLQSMQEAVVAIDRTGRILLKNQTAADLFELGATLAHQEDWSSRRGAYFPGTDDFVPTHLLPLSRALKGESGSDFDIEIRNPKVPGGRVLRCNFQPMRDEDSIIGAMVVMTDITDIRGLQADQARSLSVLRETQRRLLEAQEIGQIGNWELNLATERLWWSDEVYALFGIERSGFDGSIDAMMQSLHPDDREVFRHQREQAMKAGHSLETQYRIVRPDGAVRWIQQIGRVYADGEGAPVRRAGVVQDITARKTAEAELLLLRNAISRLHDSVIITEAQPLDEPGPRIVYANQAVERMTGYRPDQLVGRSPRMLQGPQTDREATRRLREALEARQPVRLELVNYNLQGIPYWTEIDIAPLFQDNGMLTHFIAVQRDISARKQSEQALLVSERRYAALFEQSPLPMWVFDRQTARFLAVNDAAVQQYGFSHEQFAQMDLYGIQRESGRASLAQQLQLPMVEHAGGARWTHQRKDGTEFPVEVISRSIPFYGATAVFVVAIDVTARVAAEAEVQDHVYILQRAADAAQAITQRASLQETLQEVVEQARGVVGAHQAVISLSQDADWGQSVHAFSISEKYDRWKAEVLPPPDGSGIYALVCESNRTVRLSQAELEAHPRWRGFGSHAASHPPMRGWLAVPLVGSDGRNIGVLQLSDRYEGEFSARDEYVAIELAHLATAAIEKATLIDQVNSLNAELEARIAQRTAELTRQEALFRALAEQAPQLVWTVDSHGDVTYMNRYWYELTGRAPPHGLGLTWMQDVHPDDRPAVRDNWRRSSEAGAVFAGVRRLRAGDGRYHVMSYRAAPVLDAGGQVDFWVGIDTDVTELKTYEEALKRSNEELEAFSYSVSHDLRAPLQAVDGFTRLLMRNLPPELGDRNQHYLDRIQAGVGRMSQLIEDLLSLAQVSRSAMHFRRVNLSSIARDVLDELQIATPRDGVTVQVQEGLEAECDPRLIRLVLQNLLANAWKFSAHQKHAVIAFGCDAKGAYFVRDNGAGFDMAYADKLFGAFQRLHTDKEFPGTGIGLATVKRIIDRHQGRVWAHSGPEGGATFLFTLQDDGLPPLMPGLA